MQRHRSGPGRRFLLGVLFFVTAAGALASREDPWRAIVDFRFDEAAQTFEGTQEGPKTRQSTLGHAIAVLGKPSTTEAERTRARDSLAELAGTRPSDDTGLAARYLLGRLAQLQTPKPDWVTAELMYRQVIADAPLGHAVRNQAAVKLALIILYAPSGRPAVDRLVEAEKLETVVSGPAGIRDFHLALGRGVLFFDESPVAALGHFEAALQSGALSDASRGSVLVSIGELAARSGRHDRARAVYQEFLRSFPLDDRQTMVRRALEALP